MDFWTWLSTPAGVEFTHAVIGLLIAATGAIAYYSHRVIAETSTKIDRHIREHELDRALQDEPPA